MFGKWIPVSEALPIDMGDVLITVKDELCDGDYFVEYAYYTDDEDWYCYSLDLNPEYYEVVAWMESPEPYNPNKKGAK